ncbi:tyrosinase precursor, Monophenol monooxygenase [Acrodontium crateriforme]|uniref:tyrosinase n=1 Tax=Acrodontium crateriforme TaxID=150365 RepID=A0AAQ3M6B4_9PEZI|nr:tyrosinase precursor, Monophenol monooxygenase [Acrodontium crateriforme]
MKTSLLIWAASLLTAVSSRVITTGAGSYNNVHTRYEIRDLANNHPKWWQLYLQALIEFQNMDPNDMQSYYQIAGIHGEPHANWDGFTPCDHCNAAGNPYLAGYCDHDSILFPGWHRAYVALYEQQIVSHAQSIAARYTGSDAAAWRNAASTLRVPFWDWAANPRDSGEYAPHFLRVDTFNIQTPTGTQTIKNPLKLYKIPRPADMLYTYFNTWQYTVRQPLSDGGSNNAYTDNENDFEYWQSQNQGQLKSQLYHILTQCDTFKDIASMDSPKSTQCGDSIERIHNSIHGLVGGSNNGYQGHMSSPPVAAFDPVFFLHHANVDRILALWQSLHPVNNAPNNLAGSDNARGDNWRFSTGDYQDQNTYLDPFRRYDPGTTTYSSVRWTSDAVQNWRVFGYDYPEYTFSDGGYNAIMTAVNNLYGPSGSGVVKRGAPNNLTQYSNGSQVQYMANVQYPSHALGGSYKIFFFNGEPEQEDPSSWIKDPGYVSFLSTFSSPGMNMTQDYLTSAQIPLTDHLTSKHYEGDLSDLHIGSVSKYLANNFVWRIQAPDGTSLNPEDLKGLQIGVLATSMQPLVSLSTMPVLSEYVPLPNITHGKCGGASPTSPVFKELRHKIEGLY